MGIVKIEMPSVSNCLINQCAYNLNNNCHAKAITIGDNSNPACDTYFEAKLHSREDQRVAGVGACKISICKNNNDLECMAESITVGRVSDEVKCLTFRAKS